MAGIGTTCVGRVRQRARPVSFALQTECRSGPATVMTALGVGNAHTTVTVAGNSMSASGAAFNHMTFMGGGATIKAGSTGNLRGGGACTGTPASGAIAFAGGTTCP